MECLQTTEGKTQILITDLKLLVVVEEAAMEDIRVATIVAASKTKAHFEAGTKINHIAVAEEVISNNSLHSQININNLDMAGYNRTQEDFNNNPINTNKPSIISPDRD